MPANEGQELTITIKFEESEILQILARILEFCHALKAESEKPIKTSSLKPE
ncbi:MAG: hypothetical protein IMW94_10380 [Thermoanaerobacter sp.]|nr:hypothetical protein [Thermoanaerobacter sp.]